MALKGLPLRPGLYTIDTDRGAEGRWKDGDHVRWWEGRPEKIGGYEIVTSTSDFVGLARGVIDWVSLAFEKIIGLGTHLKLYVWAGGAFTDVTPLRTSGTLGANPITTTNGSAVVNMTHVAHGELQGDYVHFSGATAVGGITVSGEYTVTSVVDADNYTITHSSVASSGASGGGAAVAYEYEIHVGAADSMDGLGWGASSWSSSTWGTARTATTILEWARTWTLDTWGEDLIANPRAGGLYVYDTSAGGRATVISGAPTTARAIYVSTENRILVALGAHDGSVDNPMLVRWCSAEDYTDWTPSATNTAGDKLLDAGNELLCAVETKSETVVFSDSMLISGTFQGAPYVFDFVTKGPNGGIAGPNAAKEFGGRVWWMADKNFMVYDGSIRILDCDVSNHVFDDINWQQRAKVFAGANRRFAEVWWLYPSGDATECDSYVLYNTKENHWSFGTLSRTVFVGDSDVFTDPYAASASGKLYTHEVGVDADGVALDAYIETGDLDIGDGEYLMHINQLIPDFKRLTGSVDVTLTGRKYPQDEETQSSGPLTIDSTTKYVNPRIRVRQASLRIECDEVGDSFRMGELRINLVQHGKR